MEKIVQKAHKTCQFAQKRAFTLIELLVVISIIALLLSILLPSLSRAKQAARVAVCAGSLQGLARGFAVYAVSNNDRYPPNQIQFFNPNMHENERLQRTCLFIYAIGDEYELHAGPAELVKNNIVEKKAFFCPGARFMGKTQGGPEISWPGPLDYWGLEDVMYYWGNYYYWASNKDFKLSVFRTRYERDAGVYGNAHGLSSPGMSLLISDFHPTGSPSIAYGGNHERRGANTAFNDGHVDYRYARYKSKLEDSRQLNYAQLKYDGNLYSPWIAPGSTPNGY